MGSVTKKWLFLKVSSAILIPLMIWFAMSLASIYDKSYNEVLTFISSQPSKLLFSMFLIFAYFLRFYRFKLGSDLPQLPSN